MDKIRLNDLTEFDLIPNGIEDKTEQKLRYFKFTSLLTYEEIFTLFNSSDNLTKVHHVLADGIINKTFTDCVALKSLERTPNYIIDDDTTAIVYTAKISVNAVEKELQTIKSNIDIAQNLNDNAIAELTIMMASIMMLL